MHLGENSYQNDAQGGQLDVVREQVMAGDRTGLTIGDDALAMAAVCWHNSRGR
jgi:hypothetical protein